MTPRKLTVAMAFFPYGGNGGVSSEHPAVGDWRALTYYHGKRDPRIQDIFWRHISDTPITMNRNAAVLMARQQGADILVMCDSDMAPDLHLSGPLGRPGAKPFFQSSFDFIYKHWDKGPCAVFAPYCGPPPAECVYMFRWRSQESDDPSHRLQLDMYTREEADSMAGISTIAAAPTGLCMFDLRMFALLEPKKEGDPFWFDYEFDLYGATKESTEDVYATRDLGMATHQRYGYWGIYGNWDCWAGHWKPKCVTAPILATYDQVNDHYKMAYERRLKKDEKLVIVGNNDPPPFTTPVHVPIFSPSTCKPATDRNGSPPVESPSRPLSEMADLKVDLGPDRLDVLNPAVDVGGSYKDRYAVDFLLRQLRDTTDHPLRVAEIGVMVGSLTCRMADVVAPDGVVYAIDHWEGTRTDPNGNMYDSVGGDQMYEAFCRNCATRIASKTVVPIKCDSAYAAATWEHGPLDFIYIDADHSYEGCAADIDAWLPHLAPGGIIAGHDYGLYHGVERAVNERFPRKAKLIGDFVWFVPPATFGFSLTGLATLSSASKNRELACVGANGESTAGPG